TVRASTLKPRPLLSDPPSAAAPSTLPTAPLLSSQPKGGSSQIPGRSNGLPNNTQTSTQASTHLSKDTLSTSSNEVTHPKRKWLASEIVSRTSQRVSAPSPQARPNAGASWSNEPEPPIQSERPMPNLVGAGPMRLHPSQRVAPASLAACGEMSARMPVD